MIRKLLRIACDKYSDDDGYVMISSAGAYIKRAMPDFDPRNYGYSKLLKLISDFPDRYEVKSIIPIPAKRQINFDKNY